MDRVVLTRAQIKKLAEQDKDYVVTATNEDAGLLLVEPLKYEGQGKDVWLKRDGRPRDEGKKL